jgi:AraC-like DNA-binding protein
LAPIGIGTPLVESLTSYLTRLAHAHGVTVESLAAAEIAPLANKSAQAARAKFSIDSHNLNGLEAWTTLTLAALTRLTRRDDLAFLTMQPWAKVLLRQNLLRPQLAWCPACFRQWQQAGQTLYIPLLWTLKPDVLCPQHQQPLCDRCPNLDCGRPLRLINSRVRLGHCPYCRRWLGDATDPAPVDHTPPADVDRLWLTGQLARLLAAAPTLAARADQALFARNFKRCVAASAPGSVQGLAQELRVSASPFFGWIHRGHPPQLPVLARVCQQLDVSMLAMLTAQPGQADDPLPPEAGGPTLPKITVEPEALQQRLARLLADPQAWPGSASRIARRLGVTPAIIQYHCPQQYRQILERDRQHQQAQRQLRQEKLAGELQAILDSDESPPPSMFEVARRLGINPRTARADCPELCRAISHQRQTFFERRDVEVEARLREILAADEPPPSSINQIAARLGENVDYLYRKFPTFCQAVTRRYRHYRPRPAAPASKPTPTTRKARNHAQLRGQFTALLVAETTPPPALAEVARQLGCGVTLLRTKHPDLCQQLRQQWDAYRQQRNSRAADRLQEILTRNEAPPPSVHVVAEQLGLDLTTLKQWLPELYAEVVRRHQAARQAERHRRLAYVQQVIADNPVRFPSLSQVANQLGCGPSTLQRQFPAQSQLIIDRYRAYRAQERAIARAALEAALSDTQHPPVLPLQVAQQLGYENKRYLQTYFPQLCHRLFQRYEAHRQQVARQQLEKVMAELGPEPPTLVTLSRQLGYHLNSLRYLCPDLCQIMEDRYQTYHQQQKQAVKATLEAILNGERAPLSVSAVGREFGYSLSTVQRCFPDLSRAVTARYKVHVRERGELRRRQLDEEVSHLTRMLFAEGIDPKLHRVILRLSSPGAAKAPHVRQAWQAARKALGLPT